MEYAQSMTMHGLPPLLKTKHKPIKLMWIVFVLASISFSIYFITNTVLEYLEYRVTTEVRIKDAKQIPFPVVTICNKNKISSNESFKYLSKIFKNFKIDFNEYKRNNNTLSKRELNELRNGLKYYNADLILGDLKMSERSLVSKSMNDMLIWALLDQNMYNSSHFEWIFNR